MQHRHPSPLYSRDRTIPSNPRGRELCNPQVGKSRVGSPWVRDRRRDELRGSGVPQHWVVPSVLLPTPSHVLRSAAGKKYCRAPPAQRIYRSGTGEGGEREEEKGGDPKGPQPITSAAQYPGKRKKEKKKPEINLPTPLPSPLRPNKLFKSRQWCAPGGQRGSPLGGMGGRPGPFPSQSH